MSAKIETHTIEDWQGDERSTGAPAAIGIQLEVERQRMLITTNDGRKIDLELQDGAIRVLCYEADEGKEAGIYVSIPERGDIMVENSDYLQEERFTPADNDGLEI